MAMETILCSILEMLFTTCLTLENFALRISYS